MVNTCYSQIPNASYCHFISHQEKNGLSAAWDGGGGLLHGTEYSSREKLEDNYLDFNYSNIKHTIYTSCFDSSRYCFVFRISKYKPYL